jgi:hypothetical protein
MKKIILYRNNNSILGSDGLMYIDGRFNINSTINEVKKRNERYFKNFPHKMADGFRFCSDRLVENGEMINF